MKKLTTIILLLITLYSCKKKEEDVWIEDTDPSKPMVDFGFKFDEFNVHFDTIGRQDTFEKILKKQTKPYHPHFHNQLFGGFDQYSVLGAMIAPAINGSVYTY